MNTVSTARPMALFLSRLRQVELPRPSCKSETLFALAVSLIWLLMYCQRFWQLSLAAMWHPSMGSVSFFISLFALVLCVQAMLLMMMPSRRLLQAASSALFLVAAASSFFSSNYGAIMNKDMMRNLMQTDRAEVGGLLSFALIAQLLVLGILPAALIWRTSLPKIDWAHRVKQRAVFFATALPLCAAGLLCNSADYAVFFREHKPIRYTIMPAAPMLSLAGLLSESHRDVNAPLLDPAGSSVRVGPVEARPMVMFLVIGETARAENFELGGYPRPTNPELRGVENLVYFSQTASCGTSTATSVPCIFSHFGREQFELKEAGRYANLLDSLAHGGFEVEWRDNNAGCKGVCARTPFIEYPAGSDPSLCRQSYCYDEVMLKDLATRLRNVKRDTVIVFHQIGSHGPAYAERYPPQFERFKPACRSNELHKCTAEEITNAYDNSIAYTDHVLARQIALLQAESSHLDGVLLYVSDHGESLGEQGIYLHGLPYNFAPQAQKHVPMLMWTSRGYDQREGLSVRCLRERAGFDFSHDNVYHTVMGAAEVRNRAYNSKLDILDPCRHSAVLSMSGRS